MKNLFKYQFISLTPLVILASLLTFKVITGSVFILFMMIYAFLFKPIIDKNRLKALNLYNGEGYWIVFWTLRLKHYSKLMFDS